MGQIADFVAGGDLRVIIEIPIGDPLSGPFKFADGRRDVDEKQDRNAYGENKAGQGKDKRPPDGSVFLAVGRFQFGIQLELPVGGKGVNGVDNLLGGEFEAGEGARVALEQKLGGCPIILVALDDARNFPDVFFPLQLLQDIQVFPNLGGRVLQHRSQIVDGVRHDTERVSQLVA